MEHWFERHKAFVLILAVSLAVRLVVLLLYLGAHDWKVETWEAEGVAQNLLDGKGFTEYGNGPSPFHSSLAPVFPFFCYLLHFLGGQGFGLYYTSQLAIAGGITWITYTVANRWVGQQTANAAALLVAIDPGQVLLQSYKVDDIALGTFFLLLGIWAFLLTTLSHDWRLACITGFVMGLAVLTRPDLMGLLMLLPVWIIMERTRPRIVLRTALFIVLAMTFVWGPWIVRNYLIHGRFVLVTSFAGEALWIGNNPFGDGTTDRLVWSETPDEFRRKIRALNEIQQDVALREEAIRYIAEEPRQFLLRTASKFYYFWWFTPTYGARSYDWVSEPLKKAYQLLYVPIALLTMLGIWIVVRQGECTTRRMAGFLLVTVFSIAAIHSITLVAGRHRVLVMPLVMILAGHGVVALGSLLRTSGHKSCVQDRCNQRVP
jgi:4-amino-4-deoxy-L-arabinose transferase-like glycosyltransferase